MSSRETFPTIHLTWVMLKTVSLLSLVVCKPNLMMVKLGFK